MISNNNTMLTLTNQHNNLLNLNLKSSNDIPPIHKKTLCLVKFQLIIFISSKNYYKLREKTLYLYIY